MSVYVASHEGLPFSIRYGTVVGILVLHGALAWGLSQLQPVTHLASTSPVVVAEILEYGMVSLDGLSGPGNGEPLPGELPTEKKIDSTPVVTPKPVASKPIVPPKPIALEKPLEVMAAEETTRPVEPTAMAVEKRVEYEESAAKEMAPPLTPAYDETAIARNDAALGATSSGEAGSTTQATSAKPGGSGGRGSGGGGSGGQGAGVPQLSDSATYYVVRPKVVYPPVSRRLGEEGKVLVRFFVDVYGKPSQITVKKSSGFPRLDEAAKQSISKTKLHPFEQNGVPVPGFAEQIIDFGLTNS